MSKPDFIPDNMTEAEYYYDPQPGWGGSGEPCSKCGTFEYFEGYNDDGQPLCDECRAEYMDNLNRYG